MPPSDDGVGVGVSGDDEADGDAEPDGDGEAEGAGDAEVLGSAGAPALVVAEGSGSSVEEKVDVSHTTAATTATSASTVRLTSVARGLALMCLPIGHGRSVSQPEDGGAVRVGRAHDLRDEHDG